MGVCAGVRVRARVACMRVHVPVRGRRCMASLCMGMLLHVCGRVDLPIRGHAFTCTWGVGA